MNPHLDRLKRSSTSRKRMRSTAKPAVEWPDEQHLAPSVVGEYPEGATGPWVSGNA